MKIGIEKTSNASFLQTIEVPDNISFKELVNILWTKFDDLAIDNDHLRNLIIIDPKEQEYKYPKELEYVIEIYDTWRE